MAMSSKFSILVLTVSILSLVPGCSESGFTSSAASEKKDDKDKKDDGSTNDTDKDNEFDTDNDADKPDGSVDLFDDFADSDSPLQIETDGTIFERFTMKDIDNEVDVVFVIDMSGSMDNELQKIEQNLGGFLDKLTADPLLKDIHLVVLAGENDESFNAPAALSNNDNFDYETDNHNIDSHNLLAVTRDYLKGIITTPKVQLRDTSHKHFIFVSDDQAKSGGDGSPSAIPEAEFRQFLDQDPPQGKLFLHAIVCPDDDDGCSNQGTAYRNLAAAYNGVDLDLRAADWSPIFDQLSQSIIENANADFKLKMEPVDSDSVAVYIDDKKVPEDEYELSLDPPILTLLGSSALEGDQTVIIKYKTEE